MSDQVIDIIKPIQKRGRKVQFVLSAATASLEAQNVFKHMIPDIKVVAHRGTLPPQLRQNFINCFRDDRMDKLIDVSGFVSGSRCHSFLYVKRCVFPSSSSSKYF